MKRLLLIVPAFLFIFLNACANSSVSAISPDIGTRVGQTQTATMWTPTVSATPEPNKANIVTWLNYELSAADPLETTLDGRYEVIDVTVLLIPGTTSAALRVHMRCQCGANLQCCSPERMFVLTMLAMKKHREEILKEVPSHVSEVKVICYDHLTRIGVMFAFWHDVRNYMNDQLTGYQLGAWAHRTDVP